MNCLAQAPLNPDTLFAACFGLFKSMDGGASWQKLPVREQRNVSSVAATGTGEGFVAIASGWDYPVFVSRDGGHSWVHVTDEVFAMNEVYQLSSISHSVDGGCLVACTSKGVFASSDGLTGWQRIGEGIPTTTTISFFTCSAPDRPRYYFACGQNQGLYRSEDLASGWQELLFPQPELYIRRVAVQWDDRRNVFAYGDAGVFRSTDGGTSWESVWPEATRRVAIASSAPTVVYAAGGFGLAISPDSGASWETRQEGLVIGNYVMGDLVVSSQSPLDAWLASFYGVYRTEDAGGSWYPSNQGISAWNVTNMAVSDRVPGLMFANCVGGLFRRNEDTGWQLLGASGTAVDLYVEWIALDPTDDATVYAWTGRELMRSRDMGQDGSWEPVCKLGGNAHSLAIDPENGDNLYLATAKNGVMVSRDSGETWHESNSGLPIARGEVCLMSMAPSDPNVLWTGLGGIFGANDIYKTTDAAQSWATVATLQRSVNCIAIDPSDPDVVYLGIGLGGNGVERTCDGGAIFLPLSEGLVCKCVQDIAIDPRDPTGVYAAAGFLGSVDPGFGLYQLDSTGLQWNSIECPEFEDVPLMKLAIDPWAEDRVLCSFAGNSLCAYQKAAVSPIELSLSTDRSQYVAGDTHIARISATNNAGDINVDLYIAIMLPDGSLWFWPGFGSEMSPGYWMTPMSEGFSMSDVVFFEMALPYGLPGGNYTWFAMCFTQGTGDAVSNLARCDWQLNGIRH